MVHGILQFTPSIAFRYVLHRCESRDIRCRESFWIQKMHDASRAHRERDIGRPALQLWFLGADSAGGSFCRELDRVPARGTQAEIPRWGECVGGAHAPLLKPPSMF